MSRLRRLDDEEADDGAVEQALQHALRRALERVQHPRAVAPVAERGIDARILVESAVTEHLRRHVRQQLTILLVAGATCSVSGGHERDCSCSSRGR